MTCCSARCSPTHPTTSRGSCWPTTFDESGSFADATRAEFIRAQCDGAQAEAGALFAAHAWRWAGLDEPPFAWGADAPALAKQFDRGFLTRLQLSTAGLARLAPLRLLFFGEPVAELVIEVGRVPPYTSVEARTLPPFPRPVRVTVVRNRVRGDQDAFFAALLSAPVMACATELSLNGVYRPGLVTWLTKSPFLGAVRSLELARNWFGCPAACDLAQNPRLAGVSRLSLALNRIGDAGARVLARSPHLRNVEELDLSGNLFGDAARDALRARFGAALVV